MPTMRKSQSAPPDDQFVAPTEVPPSDDVPTPPVRGVRSALHVGAESPDEGRGRKAGESVDSWATRLLRQHAQKHASWLSDVLAGPISIDEVLREEGIITRNVETAIRQNEIRLEDVARADGSFRAGPPPTRPPGWRKRSDWKEREPTSTSGTPSVGTASNGVTQSSLPAVQRVKGAVSPHVPHATWTLKRVDVPAESTEKTRPGK